MEDNFVIENVSDSVAAPAESQGATVAETVVYVDVKQDSILYFLLVSILLFLILNFTFGCFRRFRLSGSRTSV